MIDAKSSSLSDNKTIPKVSEGLEGTRDKEAQAVAFLS